MDSKDLVTRLEISVRFQQAVLSTRQDLINTRIFLFEKEKSVNLAISTYDSAKSRLSELISGRGAILARVGPATLYEFWLDVPGYSGTVKGAKAQLTQRGDIHQVSDVKGATKGGLGGAIVGAAFGPAGAVVGAVVGRKTTVKTEVREVDTRQYELEINGPGYAWSVIYGPGQVSALRKFRDMVNARGSRTDDVKTLVEKQSFWVKFKYNEVEKAKSELTSTHDLYMQKQNIYNQKWNEYLNLRLSVLEDLRARWFRSNLLTHIFITLIGPVAFVAWIMFFLIANHFTDPMPRVIASIIGIVYLAILIGAVAYYLIRVRLVKSEVMLEIEARLRQTLAHRR